MRHLTPCVLLLVGLFSFLVSFSQTKADSISLTFPKIVIVNNKKEILLAFDKNRKAYEVPSIGTLDGPISFKSYIDKATKHIGITYKHFRLGGIFTYIFPNRYQTFIRPYFVVQFLDYANGQPFTDTSYKWFSFNNAVKEIPYPASAKIIEKIVSHSKQVWAATFEEYGYTNPVDRSKITFNVIEDFYNLNQ
jgi:hypothetical protein